MAEFSRIPNKLCGLGCGIFIWCTYRKLSDSGSSHGLIDGPSMPDFLPIFAESTMYYPQVAAN